MEPRKKNLAILLVCVIISFITYGLFSYTFDQTEMDFMVASYYVKSLFAIFNIWVAVYLFKAK